MKSLILLLLLSMLSACAVSQAPENSIERKHYGPWEQDIGYAQITRVGDTLHISGVTSDADTMEGQVEEIYTRIRDMLQEYGAGMDSIAKETVFTTDMEALKTAIQIRKAFFTDGLYPSSSWIEIKGLYLPQFMLEVEVMAVLP